MSRDSGGALPHCPHCGDPHPEDKLKCTKTDMILPLAGRLLHGKFRLLEPIGRGGMAEVWLARNELVDREVALKLIRPEVLKHEENVARFRSEAKAAGRIGSPHICDILDFSLSPIGPFIVMERLRGVSLGEVLRARKQLPAEQAVMVIRQALIGLGAAHRAGIIHRDLKPENVFLHRPEGGDPVIKLMDFGVSKFTDGSAELETEHGVLLGTPEYMAPEQCKGARHADQRADIWAIGAILYRALAGIDAFHGETLAATLMIVATEDPRPLAELVPGIDPDLVTIIEKCLAKNPEDRYPDTDALSTALAAFEGDDAERVWDDLGTASEALTGLASAPTQIKVPQPSEVVTAPREVVSPETEPAPARSPRWAAVAGLAILVGGIAFFVLRGDEEAEPGVAASEVTNEASEAATVPPPPSEAPEPDEPSPPLPEPADGGDTDTQPNRPPPLPPPETDDGAAPTPNNGAPPSELVDPKAVVRGDKWITPVASARTTDQPGARRYCEQLARDGHLGITDWKLANPTIAAKFVGARDLKKARYWTSAAHKGRAISVGIPSGKQTSLKVSKKSARPLCISKWP